MDPDVRLYSVPCSLSLISVSEKPHQQRRRRVQKLRKIEDQSVYIQVRKLCALIEGTLYFLCEGWLGDFVFIGIMISIFFLYLFFVFVSWIVIKDDKIFPCPCEQFFSLFKYNLWMENEMNQMWLANHFVYLTNFGLFQRAKLVELTAMSMGKKEWKF